MGPIQASLNQLTLSILGSVVGVSKGLSGGLTKPKAKVDSSLNTNVTNSMGNIVKIGCNSSGYGRFKAATAAMSGNDMIAQKARATYRGLERLKKATETNFTGGTK